MIRALAIIFACLSVGQLLVSLTGIMLPASIVGLLLLFGLLQSKLVRAEWFKPLTDFLLQNLMLMILPPAIGIIEHLELLGQHFWSIAIAAIGSSVLVIWLTAKTHAFMRSKCR